MQVLTSTIVNAVLACRSDYHGEISSVVDSVASNSASKIGTACPEALIVRHHENVSFSKETMSARWCEFEPRSKLNVACAEARC